MPGSAIILKRLRRRVVQCAPNCTLWVLDYCVDVLRFKFWPKWTIAFSEYREARN